MKVPNIDYSPLAQAYQNKKAAVRASYIAPKIGYMREGFQLEEKGLELKGKGIQLENSYNRFKTGIKVGQLLASAASAASAAKSSAQTQAANAMMNDFKGQLDQTMAEKTASGELGIETIERPNGDTTTKINGIESINRLRETQIEQIKAQGWDKDIEQNAISSLNGMYNNSQTNMYIGFYAQSLKDRNAWQEQNRKIAIANDAAEVNYTDHRHIDGFIESIKKDFTPLQLKMLKDSMYQECDIDRATNTVRDIASKSGEAPAIEYANQYVAEHPTLPDGTGDKLVSAARNSAHQTKVIAEASGNKFMTDVINSGSADMGEAIRSAWAEAKEKASHMSPEAGEAYLSGMETVQLKKNTDTYLSITTNNDPEMMQTSEEVREFMENNLIPIDGEFNGTMATRSVGDKLNGIYESRYNQLKKEEDAEARTDEYVRIEGELSNITTPEELEAFDKESITKNDKLTKTDKKMLLSRFNSLNKAMKKATAEDNSKAFIAQQNAYISEIVPALLNGDITIDQARINLSKYMSDTKAASDSGLISEAEAKKITTTALKIGESLEKELKTKHGDQFAMLRDMITTDMKTIYGVDGKKAFSPEQLQGLNEMLVWGSGELMSAIGRSPDMSDADVLREVDRIRKSYAIEKYEILSREPQLGNGDNVPELAMGVTQRFQDEDVFSIDKDTKQVTVNPLYRDIYQDALDKEKAMLITNYQIPATTSTLIKYKGKVVPEFKDSEGRRYIVMDSKVYRRWENHLEEKKPVVGFNTENGYGTMSRQVNNGYTVTSPEERAFAEMYLGRKKQ